MKNYLKKDRGITLIALVITIIIMLILVAVTIDIAVDGKLFDKAQEAVDQTNDKVGKTQNKIDDLIGFFDEIEGGQTGGNITGDGTQTECTHEYGEWNVTKVATCSETGLQCKECTKCGDIQEQEIPKLAHGGYSNGVCPECGETVEVVLGATIDYKEYKDPTTETAFTTMPFYQSTSDKNGYTDTTYTVANNSGIEWIVLGEENGQIKITTKDTVKPSEGGEWIEFESDQGYMNFIDELCEIGAIYGKGKHADTDKFTVTTGGATGGRSFIMEDLGYNNLTRTAEYIYAMHSNGNIYQYPITATAEDITNELSTTRGTESVFKYINIDGSNSTSETDKEWKSLTDTGNSTTIYDYTYGGSQTLSTDISKADESYWLASRDVVCYDIYVCFCARYVDDNGNDNKDNLFYSSGLQREGAQRISSCSISRV